MALMLFGATAANAQALSSADARCRNFIESKVRVLAGTVLLETMRCHDKRLRGLINAGIDCSDPSDPGFPAASTTLINSAASRLSASIEPQCAAPASSPAGNGYATCPSPCNASVPAITSYSDVAACMVCLAKSRVHDAVATVFGASPPVQGSATAAWRCQYVDVGLPMMVYAKVRMQQQQSCQYREDLGRIAATDCVTADLYGVVATATQRLNSLIARCTEADLAALTTCSSTIPGEQTCVKAATDALVDALAMDVYPTRPTPTPTLTRTATPIPTATATPSPTPSTGPCAATNFLDVSGAAGPGGSYAALRPSLSVSCSAATVTVQSNGIPTYQYIALTPNGLQAKNYNFSFARSPSVAATTTAVSLLGSIGVAVNGIPIFGPNEAATPDYYGDPIAAAILDQCGSHSGAQGSFHNHELAVKCLIQSAVSSSQPWNNPDPSPSDPSPIIGYAFDGFPIYGPYECTDSICTSVQRMLSAWDNTGYQAGTIGCASSAACANGYCTEVMVNGTLTTACVPKTCVWSNNQYSAKVGSQYLDRCNGHYGPNGDYHYHTTPTFPYILGCYRGTPTNNGGTGTPPGGTCPSN
jgi:hypothetical protein